MSNVSSIQPTPIHSAPVHAVRAIQPAGDPTAAGKDAASAKNTPEPKPVQPYTNPDLRLDPALGLVVIEFHDESGKLINSIPNQRQIDAYRLHDVTLPGQIPAAWPASAPDRAGPAGPKTAIPDQQTPKGGGVTRAADQVAADQATAGHGKTSAR